MSDQILSQEEIDALLRGSDSSQGEAGDEVQNADIAVQNDLTIIEKDALGEIGNITMGSAATTLSTLLGRKVSITTPKINVIKIEQLIEDYPLPYVAIDVKYTKGIEGANLLILGRQESGIIVDLMMGGDGTNPPQELTELHLSGVSEAMNQMMGTSATSLATMLNRSVDISPPHAQLSELTPPVVNEVLNSNDSHIVKVSFRMIVEDLIDSEVMQILPMWFAKDLIGHLLGDYQPEDMTKDNSVQEINEIEQPSYQSPPVESVIPEKPIVADSQYNGSQYNDSFARSNNQQQPKVERDPKVEVRPVQFAQLGSGVSQQELDNIGLIMDVPLQLTVELGRTRKTIKEILDFSVGTIIELDKLAGEPVDIMANGKLIAKGEVVVIDENFGVRVTDIVSPMERMKNLQ